MIYKHYTGAPQPDIPKNAKSMGVITEHHNRSTQTCTWYTDNPKADQSAFDLALVSAKIYNKKTSPAIWQ